ncbi:hypothetical protein MKW98_018255 [Papaver atlanticum]|uniref:UBC core domain-containing protein n=1 Tax=Papaver atlanticum TaxID=357466 RepID=A0AAD4S4T8_9MAGN|nr:hypothetical protein MKW98_018255 [Papaver atlanticum]
MAHHSEHKSSQITYPSLDFLPESPNVIIESSSRVERLDSSDVVVGLSTSTNILREDWKPVLNINTLIYGLNFLFTHPNHEDPLNHEAAAVLRDNPKTFEANVRRAMAGGYVGNTTFSRCLY